MSEAPESKALAPHYASVSMAAFGGGGSLPALQNLADVVSIAQLMAKSQVAVPKHLRDNPGACLAVTMQALRWEMEPFAVANKSYSVNDRLAYESQLIAAVILTRANIVEEPDYEYTGEGDDRVCTVMMKMRSGKSLSVSSPKFGKIQPKNSPLWKSDPDQQLGYYTIRAWARRHQPQVILGVYDREEAESEFIRDVTPQKSGLMDRLDRTNGDGGFSEAAIAEIEEHAPKARRAKKVDTPQEAQEALQSGEAVEVPDTYETPATDDEKPISEVLEGDDIPEHLRRLAGGIPHDAETGEVIEEEPESPPEDAPTVEESSDTQVSVTDASEGSPEETSGLSDSSAPEATSETPEPDLPEELASYIETVESADTWLTFKKAMATFYATETFKKLGDDGQNRIRAQTWHLVNEMGQNGGERVDPGADISAFRLWLEYTSDQEAIEGTFAFLQRGEQFRNAATQQQSGLKLAVNRRLERIGGIQ